MIRKTGDRISGKGVKHCSLESRFLYELKAVLLFLNNNEPTTYFSGTGGTTMCLWGLFHTTGLKCKRGWLIYVSCDKGRYDKLATNLRYTRKYMEPK